MAQLPSRFRSQINLANPLILAALFGGSPLLQLTTFPTIKKFTIMSQFWFDTYVNMIGSTALNYYNVEAIDKCSTSNDEEDSI